MDITWLLAEAAERVRNSVVKTPSPYYAKGGNEVECNQLELLRVRSEFILADHLT